MHKKCTESKIPAFQKQKNRKNHGFSREKQNVQPFTMWKRPELYKWRSVFVKLRRDVTTRSEIRRYKLCKTWDHILEVAHLRGKPDLMCTRPWFAVPIGMDDLQQQIGVVILSSIRCLIVWNYVLKSAYHVMNVNVNNNVTGIVIPTDNYGTRSVMSFSSPSSWIFECDFESEPVRQMLVASPE